MRNLPFITELWERGGPFIGENRPNGFVTVEPGWYLNTEGHPGRLATSRRPVRWWQRSDNSQEEKELPGVMNIETNRSLSADAGEATITVLNVLPRYNLDVTSNDMIDEWGYRGALSPNYGQTETARSMWGHERNEWYRILRPGAVLRTFQGYGGHGKTREQCIADGNVVLTGVWRVDTIERNSDGDLTFQCRDMAGLLIDQSLYPPLVPAESYPLNFYPYTYDTRQISNPPAPARTARRNLRYATSSADAWYGPDASIHGHRASHSVDGNTSTFALSVGNSHPSRAFCTDFWQYTVNGQINAINLNPWRGGYTMYVSVMENGQWQGNSTVPYDFGSLSHQPGAVNTNANIPYVASFQVPWEQARRYQLPRVFNAQRVRISFRNHTRSSWGPWFYRCGIREVYAEMHEASPAPMWADITGHVSGHGYWAVSQQGRVQWFGDAVNYGSPNRSGTVSIEATSTGEGYWVLNRNGTVNNYGNAFSLGNASVSDAVDLVRYDDFGYWIISRSTGVHSFGSAPSYGSIPGNAVRGAKVPGADGLYVLHRGGTVSALGDATHHGNGTTDWQYIDIVARSTGYFLVRTDGGFVSFDAGPVNSVWETDQRPPVDAVAAIGSPTIGGDPVGYGTLSRTGSIGSRAQFSNLGSPADGVAHVRRPGNFSDLSEVVKLLLLWSGFWLQGGNTPSEEPAVYGSIEYTGFTPEAPIPADVFDKKPVIDAITYLKEITGYNFFIDQEGAVRYGSANIWASGNFLPDGTHTDTVLDVSDRQNLTNYSTATTLKNERKRVTVTDGEPLSGLPGVRAASWVNSEGTQDYLFGLESNAMVTVPIELTRRDMQLMASIIGIRMRMKRRTASAQCAANPAIDIDDQIRIWERTTGDVFFHYVHSISTSHDFNTGVYTMDLGTHWLSGGEAWSIQVNEARSGARVTTEAPELSMTVEEIDNSLGFIPQEDRQRSTNRINFVNEVREEQVPSAALDSDDSDENGGSAT